MEITYYFEWRDYLLFTLMLIASSLIGIYYGIKQNTESSLKEYLLGGENMKVIPVGLSITASILNSIAMAALPAEVYNYGIMIALINITIPITVTIMYYSILPVFYNLKLTSIYEYMALRFDGRIHKITSLLYALNMLTFLPVVICLSAISLEQGTGFNTIYISILICFVCTFYTTIGGIRTVIWTDCLQLMLMFGSAFVIVVIGTIQAGGFWNVLHTSKLGGRLDFDFDLDATKKDTFWTLGIGNCVFWLQLISYNQAYVQKCFTLPSMQHIKRALILVAISLVSLFSLVMFTGLIIYTEFRNCDPMLARKIQYHDQLVSFYILKTAILYPGVSGMFIAGLTSGAISTLSAGMNALSVTIYRDFVGPCLPKNTSEYKIGIFIKITAIMVGAISTSIVYIISKLGSAFPVFLSFGGITSGPIFGLYLLSMFTTSANAKGAFFGVIGSVSIMSWIVLGSLYYRTNKMIVYPTKIVSTEYCYLQYNNSNIANSTELFSADSDWKPFFLYRVSFFYYTIMGASLVIIIGLIVSWFTKTNGTRVKKELLSPWMLWSFRRNNKNYNNEDSNFDNEGATEMLSL